MSRPSKVTRPFRRHGRTRTRQKRATIPIGPRIWKARHDAFIHPGGEVGPLGTVLKKGPVIQSPQMYSSKATITAPTKAQILTGDAGRTSGAVSVVVAGRCSVLLMATFLPF